MANPLNRDLKAGDKVVLVGGDTAVVSILMFGARAATTGSALGVRRPGEQVDVKISSHDIDAAATMERHAVDNGWRVCGDVVDGAEEQALQTWNDEPHPGAA